MRTMTELWRSLPPHLRALWEEGVPDDVKTRALEAYLEENLGINNGGFMIVKHEGDPPRWSVERVAA
jgi:hypothetical protein